MVIAAGALAASTVAAAGISASAAGGAADKSAAAAREGTDFAKSVFHNVYEESRPYRIAGTDAVTRLADLYGLNGGGAQTNALAGFQTSPGYQFRLDQGLQAINRSQNAKGMLGSGATLKALNDYAAGSASQEYGNYVAGLGGLTNTGTNALGVLASAGSGAANNVTAGANAIGNANAFGSIGQANAINGGINSLASLAGLLSRNNASSYPSFYGGGGGFNVTQTGGF